MIFFSFKTNKNNFNSKILNLPADIMLEVIDPETKLLFEDYIFDVDINFNLSTNKMNGYHKLRITTDDGSVFDVLSINREELLSIVDNLQS